METYGAANLRRSVHCGFDVWPTCVVPLCPVAMARPNIQYRPLPDFYRNSTTCPIQQIFRSTLANVIRMPCNSSIEESVHFLLPPLADSLMQVRPCSALSERRL